MTLPTSGPLSFNAINTELGRSATAQMSLKTAETGGYVAINQNSPSKPDGNAPYKVSEWYGYNQNAPAPTGTIYLVFSRFNATGTARVYKNATLFLSRTTSGTSSGVIATGDTFYGNLVTSIANPSTMEIDSSTRGNLYSFSGNGSHTSSTFTRQSGEDITVTITVGV